MFSFVIFAYSKLIGNIEKPLLYNLYVSIIVLYTHNKIQIYFNK